MNLQKMRIISLILKSQMENNMAWFCTKNEQKVLYLDCQECEEKRARCSYKEPITKENSHKEKQEEEELGKV